MSRKRSLLMDLYRNPTKRYCSASSDGASSSQSSTDSTEKPYSDVKAALFYIKANFPVEKFNSQIPAIIMKHQIYSIVFNRTTADQQLIDLRNDNEVLLFRLGPGDNNECLVFTEDYITHISRVAQVGSYISEKLLSKIISRLREGSLEYSISRKDLHVNLGINDGDITQLINAGILAGTSSSEIDSFWLSIPRASLFTKAFNHGRKSILTMVRKCKYTQILQKELEEKKLPKLAKLGIQYHVLDLIGGNIVNWSNTSSGILLQLKPS